MRLDRTQLAKAMARARDAPHMFTPTDPEPVPELGCHRRLPFHPTSGLLTRRLKEEELLGSHVNKRIHQEIKVFVD